MRSRFLIAAFSALTLIYGAGEAAAETVTLGEGLKLVTEGGRLVRIAAEDEEMAKDDALVRRAVLFPRVNASLRQTSLAYQPQAIFGNNTVPVSQQNFLAYSLNVQQTLYDFKRTASRYAAGNTIVDTRKLDTQKIRNNAAIDFATAYYDLLESEQLARVSEMEVERLKSHLTEAQNLFAEGVITKNDLLQAQVRLSDAGQRLIGAKNLKSIHASRINNALMKPLTSTVAVAEVARLDQIYPEKDLEKAWELSLRERPEIKIAEETMKVLNLEEQAKKTEFYPELFVRGSYDYTENRYQVNEGNWALIFGIDVNLFSGGSTKAEVARFEHQKARIREEKAKLVDDIKMEVQRNLLETETALQKSAAVKDAMQQAEENLRINRTRYQEGVGTATELLDAVTLLTIAETNYYRALYDLGRAEARAMYSQGRNLAEAYK